MNVHHLAAAVVLLAAAQSTQAQQPLRTLPSVQAVQYVFECQSPRRLPTQAQVAEWTGQHNFSQVYDTRTRLMGEIGRACRRPGIEQVQLVLSPRDVPATADQRRTARVAIAAN